MNPRVCKYPKFFKENIEEDKKLVLNFQEKHEGIKDQQDKIREKIAEIEKSIEIEARTSCMPSIRGPNFYYIHCLELEKEVLERMNKEISQKNTQTLK